MPSYPIPPDDKPPEHLGFDDLTIIQLFIIAWLVSMIFITALGLHPEWF